MNENVKTSAGVVGAGRMGSGIAHALLLAGHPVTLVDLDQGQLDQAVGTVRRYVESGLRHNPDGPQVDEILGRLRTTLDIADLQRAELLIEAVSERFETKTRILTAMEAAVSDSCLIATNTSSISITELSEHLRVPGRFIGLHFFNPVPVSELLEIVVGKRTADETLARALVLANSISKTPITVRDAPGFASSRLGIAIAMEAIRMVEEGVASPADIDAAMTIGYKHPMGPLRLTDLVGLDVRLAIAEYLESQLGPRFAPPELLRSMVAAGKLGRKTGQGFFEW